MNDERTYPFVDPVSNTPVTLVIGPPEVIVGVRHPDCDALARVTPELDCFSCTSCRYSGRISGAWFVDVVGAVRREQQRQARR